MTLRKPKEKVDKKYFFDQAMNVVAWIVILVLFVVFPLYFRNGYEMIATNKYIFYISAIKYICISTAVCIVVFYILWGFNKDTFRKPKISLYIIGSLGLYAFTNLLSFLFSKYKMVSNQAGVSNISWFVPGSFYGEKSWYMGFLTMLIVTLSALYLGYFINYSSYIFIPIIGGGVVVACLGLLNRYSVYPIEMKCASESFISTMGNIDWFCGYLIIIAPLSYGIFVSTKSRKVSILMWFVSLIFLAITIVSGAESGIFALLITLVVLLAISFKDEKRLYKYSLLLFALATSAAGIRVADFLYPKARNMKGGIIEIILSTPVILIILSLAFVLFILMTLVKKGKLTYSRFWQKNGSRIVIGLFVLAILLVISLIFINTFSGKKLPLIGKNPYFKLSMKWGSNRGACYCIAVKTFQNLPFINKVFGAGPDAFSFAAYESQEVKQISVDFLYDLKLTNAHNEILTILVNEGIVGLLSFATMWVVIFKTARKLLGKDEMAIVFILAFVSYLANNVFSFRQIESTPLLYALLGIYISFAAKVCKVDKRST